jgi:hypothetical protein
MKYSINVLKSKLEELYQFKQEIGHISLNRPLTQNEKFIRDNYQDDIEQIEAAIEILKNA